MNTIGAKDILPEGKTQGFRLKIGTMSNTVEPPPLYTKGGYQTEFISKCITDNPKCKVQTHEPEARYAGFTDLNLNAHNFSLAFANKWDSGDLVLSYAKRKQGNYFVGSHGQTPVVSLSAAKKDWAEIDGEDEEVEIIKVEFEKNRGTLYRAGEEALNTSQDNHSYLAKLNLYDDDHRLGLTYRRYRSKFGEIMPSIINFRGTGALQGEGTEVKVDGVSASYQYRSPNSPYISFKGSIYSTDSDTSSFTPLLDSWGYDFSQRHAHFVRSQQKGISLDNASTVTVGGKPLVLKYGAAFSYERIDTPHDYLQRVKRKNYPEDAVAPLYKRDGKREESSVFIAANYPLTSRLTADVGGRYISSVTQDYIVGQGKTKQDPPIKNRGWAPIAMLTFELSDSIQLYAKYAGALRSPSLFQGTKGWSVQETKRLEVLRPERAKNINLGMNMFYENPVSDSIFGFKLDFFNNTIKDYITRTFVPAQKLTQPTNIDSAQFQGVEVSGVYDMRKLYGKLAATYYTKTKFCLRPEHLTHVFKQQCHDGMVRSSNLNHAVPPEIVFHLTAGVRLFDGKLDTGVRWGHYGKRFTLAPAILADDRQNSAPFEWAPYSLVDLYANYAINKDLKLNITVDNFFNRYYLDANNMGLHTAPGRVLHVGIDYRF